MTQPLVTAPTVVWTSSDQRLRLVLAPPTGHYGPKAVFIFEEGAVDVMGQTGWRSQADDCNKQRRCENLELVLCDVIAECRRLATENQTLLGQRDGPDGLRAKLHAAEQKIKELSTAQPIREMAQDLGKHIEKQLISDLISDQIIDVADDARQRADLIYYKGELMTRKRAAELAKAAGGH